MPFSSEAQRRYLYAKHPDIAKEFADKTSEQQMKNLPEKKQESCPSCHRGKRG